MPKVIQSATEEHRLLALLTTVLRDRGEVTLRRQAQLLGIPPSTAYRLAGVLHRSGLIRRAARGAFAQGLELASLTSGIKTRSLLAQIARPHLRQLAQRLHMTVHLGVLEKDMVSYLVKEQGGGPEIFTRAGTQLEAYCSAIGKVLLAALPASQLEAYLGAGPLVALTPNTITAPSKLKRALQVIREDGYAVDAEEVIEDLRCVAVPIVGRFGRVVAAASVSTRIEAPKGVATPQVLAELRKCSQRIAAHL